MNLAATYEKFIERQNKILANFISSNNQNKLLLYFKDEISKEILFKMLLLMKLFHLI